MYEIGYTACVRLNSNAHIHTYRMRSVVAVAVSVCVSVRSSRMNAYVRR